jgi:hypothetical protein
MIVNFICGCTHDVNEEDIGWWREVGMDRQGFLICVTHTSRRQGWRSLPSARDFASAQFSPLERERMIVFGERVRRLENPVWLESKTPDRRDNRDPEILGREILAKGNGK